MKWRCSDLQPGTQVSDRKNNCGELCCGYSDWNLSVLQQGLRLRGEGIQLWPGRRGRAWSNPGVKRQQASWTANPVVLRGGCPSRVAHRNSELVVPFSACNPEELTAWGSVAAGTECHELPETAVSIKCQKQRARVSEHNFCWHEEATGWNIGSLLPLEMYEKKVGSTGLWNKNNPGNPSKVRCMARGAGSGSSDKVTVCSPWCHCTSKE